MPVVTKEMSSKMARNKWRPNCYKCGMFIGVGGYYDVVWDGYNGGWEEGYSTCKRHTASCGLVGHPAVEAARKILDGEVVG